jgi:hypothetical protein
VRGYRKKVGSRSRPHRSVLLRRQDVTPEMLISSVTVLHKFMSAAVDSFRCQVSLIRQGKIDKRALAQRAADLEGVHRIDPMIWKIRFSGRSSVLEVNRLDEATIFLPGRKFSHRGAGCHHDRRSNWHQSQHRDSGIDSCHCEVSPP